MEGPPKRVASAGLPGQAWAPPGQPPRRGGMGLVVLGLGLGTMLEWYDFQVYSAFASILMPMFFPSTNPTAEALAYWGVFAVAFVTRPLGSMVFGHIADGVGRKLSLLISLLAMGLPTTIIGCLPTYEMIGIAAPILLALLRAIQGMAVGGEFGTAIVYISELAPPGWEGRQTSVIVAMCNAGILLGNLVTMLVIGVCTPQQLRTWGWRIPFLFVIVTVALAYVLRRRMPDTEELLARARLAAEDASGAARATEAGEKGVGGGGSGAVPGGAPGAAASEPAAAVRHKVPLGALLLRHPLPLALHTLTNAYAAAAFYSFTAWLPAHLNKLGVPLLTTQVMLCSALVVLIATVCLTGLACDRGLPVCWAGGALCLGGAALPFALCAAARAYVPGSAALLAAVWLVQVFVMTWAGAMLALLPTIGVNIYDASVRASGYNLGYSLAFGLVGGLSPVAVTAINSSSPTGAAYGVALWVMAWGLVGACAYAAVLFLFPACNRTAAVPVCDADRWPPADPAAAAQLRAPSLSAVAPRRAAM